MFAEGTPQKSIDAFEAPMRAFHPQGFRAMARASAEDLRDALPGIGVPTLLVYGDRDVRAPLAVAEHLHAEIAGSRLVVLPGVGHVCNIEAPDAFNAADPRVHSSRMKMARRAPAGLLARSRHPEVSCPRRRCSR